jgi:hypothetical protein
MPMPLVATMLCFATAATSMPAVASWRYAVAATARETWLSWALLGVYLEWRARLFDSIWKVYVASTLPSGSRELFDRLSSFRFIVMQNIGAHYAVWITAVGLALVWGVASQELRSMPKRQWAIVGALFMGAALYFVAPASSFYLSNEFGEGARHFYPAWMLASLSLAMMFAWRPRRRLPALAFVLILFAGQTQSLAQWHSASMQMERIVEAIEGFAVRVSDDQYALLLLPDHEGVAFFARNAQGAIVMRPVQHADYLSRMVVMLSADLEQWSRHLRGGEVSEFKAGRAFDPVNFLGLYCWNPALGKIISLTSGMPPPNARAWRQEAERNFVRAGCLPPF